MKQGATRRRAALDLRTCASLLSALGVALAPTAADAAPKDVDLEVGGQVQVDFRSHSYPEATPFDKDDHVAAFDIRRARLQIDGTVGDYYRAKVSADFASSPPKLRDAYIEFAFYEPMTLQLGQFTYPFGNEPVGSSLNQEFIEDSSISTALSASRDRGFALTGELFDDALFYKTGFMNGAGDNTADNNSSMDYMLRVAGRPLNVDDGFFQGWLGVSLGVGTQTPVEDESIEIAAESASGATFFKATLPTNRDYDRTRFGLDLTLLVGPAMLRGEWLGTTYTFEQSAVIQGGYIMASVFLTGEQRSIKNGYLSSQEPDAPLDFWMGDAGAWELALRFSWFDVDPVFFENNGLYTGWTAVSASDYVDFGSGLTLGLNWYPDAAVRIMLDWVGSFSGNPSSSDPAERSGESRVLAEQAVLMRFQVAL